MTGSERWFRPLLWLYPRDFREEMGDAMVEAYVDRARAARAQGGRASVASVWFAALRESVRNGPAERARPTVRWRRTGNWGRDTELAMRRLARSPLFVLMLAGTLTVGLGAFAVVYTVVDRVLLAPLPYDDPDDLYWVWRDYTWFEFDRGWLGGPDIAALREAGGVIQGMAGMQRSMPTLSTAAGGEPVQIAQMTVSPDLFGLLGVQPALGRDFAPDETGPDRPQVAIITHGLWQRLGGERSILGSEIRLNGNPWEVIGVLPRDFQFVRNASLGTAQGADVYVPYLTHFAEMNPGSGSLAGLLRAQPGTTPERLQEAVSAVGHYVDERDHDSRGLRLYAVNAKQDLIAPVRPAMLVLGLAGVFLLLVLLVNLGTLLLARAAQREQEFAVSRALGANPIAVVRATVLEAVMLGVLGGIGGALVATWGTQVLVGMAPADLPRLGNIAFNWNLALTVVAIGAGIGLLAGVAPALWAVRTDLGTLMGSTRQRGGGGRVRMRRGMVVVQVALSVVLLTAGALVVRSFTGLLRVDPGFDAARAFTLTIPVPGTRYPDADAVYALHARLEAELAAVPGVSAVGAGWTLPLSAGSSQTSIRFPGAPGNTGIDEQDNPMIDFYAVRPGYFEALGVRVLEGETFRETVTPDFEMLIDRTLAERFYPDGTAVGASIPLGEESARIIGVVDHVRLYDVHQDGRGQIFLPNAPGSLGMANTLSWVVRSERTVRAPAGLAADATAAVRRVDPELAVADVRTMSAVLDAALSEQRLSATLIAGFSLGALLLAAMGLYGVVAGSVTRRRHELAIRMAVGAGHGRVLRLVLREGALLVALGIMIGVPAVLLAGRVLQGVLVGVSPRDPVTLVAVAAGLWTVAMLACYLPARRVLRIEPGMSLRQE